MNKQSTIDFNTEQRKKALETLLIESGGLISRKEGISNAVRATNVLLKHWILTEYRQLVRQETDEDLAYHDEVIASALDMLEFVVKVSECHESAQFYQRTIREMQKEGGGLNHE